jgi:hypothetical protein
MATTCFTTRHALRHLAGRAGAWLLPVVVAGGLLATAPSTFASPAAQAASPTRTPTAREESPAAPEPTTDLADADNPCPSGIHDGVQWEVACGTTVNGTGVQLTRESLAINTLTWAPEPAETIGAGQTDTWSAQYPALMGSNFGYKFAGDNPDNPGTHEDYLVYFDFANWSPFSNVAQCHVTDWEGTPTPLYACSATYGDGVRARAEMKVWRT